MYLLLVVIAALARDFVQKLYLFKDSRNYPTVGEQRYYTPREQL